MTKKKILFISALTVLVSLGMERDALAERATSETHAHAHKHGAAPTSSHCHLPVVLSEEAERRAGGALYRAPSSTEAAHQLNQMSHAEHVERADPKHHHHGVQRHDDSAGMHSIHEPQFGGRSFFMAPNKLHHLEALYSDDCGFRLVIYNAYTQPIAVNRFQAFIKVIPENEELPEMIRFLSPSADGTLLVAAMATHVPPPFEIELYLKFPESEDPELFNIRISTP